MTATATDTTTTTTTAADAAVAASTATATDDAAKAAADKAAADKATADAAAAAGKTPEQLAAEKAASDKAAADKAAADAAAKVVPDRYELKLPDNSTADVAIVEKTAAIARELGLSQDNAQKALTFVAQEVANQVTAQQAAWEPPSDTNKEGGAKWREQEEAWRAASLADKDLGNGKPEQLTADVTLAKKVIAKFGDAPLAQFFEKSGLGSNPATLRFLKKIGSAMSEGSLVIADATVAKDKSEAAVASRLYDHPTSKSK